jgi:F0F1-type ATP synthase assembly protein I
VTEGSEPQDDAPEEDTGLILKEYRRVMYQFSFIGIEFGVAIILGYLLGHWIDEQLDSAPWGMLIVLALSLTAAGRDFVRVIKKAKKIGESKANQTD